MILKQKQNRNKTTRFGLMGVCLNCHGHVNNQVYEISWTKTTTKVSLIPNLNHEIRKMKTKTWHVQNKNSIKIYWKNKIRTKQIYYKKMYPKTNVEQIKGSGESYLYLFTLDT